MAGFGLITTDATFKGPTTDRLVEIIPLRIYRVNHRTVHARGQYFTVFSRWIAPTIVSWCSHQTRRVSP